MKPLAILKKGFVAAAITASAASPSSAADSVKVMFDWIPGGWHAAWYAGKVNGCFGDRKLEVSLQRGSGGVDTVAKVASELADVGMADLGTVTMNRMVLAGEPEHEIPVIAERTPLQRRAFKLLGADPQKMFPR